LFDTAFTSFAGSQREDELEALNTDVMRFLAIIALCLLAVFAAVSSEIPQSAREMIEVQDGLIATQDQQAVRLEAEKQEIQRQFSEQIVQSDRLQRELERLQRIDVDAKDRQIRELQVESRTMLEALNNSDRKYNRLSQELQEQKDNNDALLQTVASLQQQLNSEKNLLQHSEAKLQQLHADQQQAVRAQSAVDVSPLTLRFASNRALMTLIQAGTVRLFAIAAPGLWRYEAVTEGFTPVDGHENLYEIDRVPGGLNALAAAVTGHVPVSWGVVLNSAIQMELGSLLGRVDGGEIVVNADGSLTHQP